MVFERHPIHGGGDENYFPNNIQECGRTTGGGGGGKRTLIIISRAHAIHRGAASRSVSSRFGCRSVGRQIIRFGAAYYRTPVLSSGTSAGLQIGPAVVPYINSVPQLIWGTSAFTGLMTTFCCIVLNFCFLNYFGVNDYLL